MNGYYLGKTKVVCEDLMCFPVNTKTLEPLACSSYDPYAWCDPDRDPEETITYDEWLVRHRSIMDRAESDSRQVEPKTEDGRRIYR